MSFEIIAFAVAILTVVVAAGGKGAVWSAPALIVTFLLAVGSFGVVSFLSDDTLTSAGLVSMLQGSTR